MPGGVPRLGGLHLPGRYTFDANLFPQETSYL